MKSLKWLGIAAGFAALAACGSADEANNMTSDDELNAMAVDNMTLPPIDMNADMNADVNATTNDVANDMNMTSNTDTTVNGY